MYLTLYGLAEKPFNPTPDPRFFHMTLGHREALAQLVRGTQERKGFIVLIGKVGTGKTTLLHALWQRLEAQSVVSFVKSTLPFDRLLENVLEDFGIASAGESRTQRLIALNHFLIKRQRDGQNTVLIIDEAQNLDVATLEQIRLLSDFETPKTKLLQILLVGQPELKAKLDLPELRQLEQRVGLRCQIPPLTLEETHAYIRTRLRIAGTRDLGLFTDRAVDRIAVYSGGIPRLINAVCDRCLLFGYADQKRRIDRQIVEQAIVYLEEGIRPQRNRMNLRGSKTRLLLRWGIGRRAVTLASALAAPRPQIPDGRARTDSVPPAVFGDPVSKCFRALECVEQERALRRSTTPSELASAPSPGDPADMAPAWTPQSGRRASHPAATEPEHTTDLEERAPELDETLVSLRARTSFAAEQYRELRHAIERLHRLSGLSVIAISSAVPGDGKTTTAINLAGALAQAPDARILLVDADLRVPSLGASLGIGEHGAFGLVDAILNASLTLEAVTQAQPHVNLSVITAGQRPSAPYEVLKSRRVGQLLAEARGKYDYVIVDTPPVVSVPDGRVFGEWVDGFLVVVAAHRTPRKLLEETFNLMEPNKFLGLVFNGDHHHVSRKSYSSYRSYDESRSRISRNGTSRG